MQEMKQADNTDNEEIEIKAEKTTGFMSVLKVTYYKGCPVYIRKIKEDMFTYDVIFDNQLYSSYIIVTPEKGKRKLTQKQMIAATGLIFAGANTTIDTLIENRKEEMLSNAVAKSKAVKQIPKRKKKLN